MLTKNNFLLRRSRDRWVDYDSFSKRLDFSPNTTQYFWHLDEPGLRASILEQCYKTILNMRIKGRVLLAECDTADLQAVSWRGGDDAVAMRMSGMSMENVNGDNKPVSLSPVELALCRTQKLERAILSVDRTVRMLGL